MKTRLLLLFTFFSAYVFAQNGSLRGTVVDAKNGTTLIGVNVVIKSAKKGTITDGDGKFTIGGIEPGIYEIEFTMIGYLPKNVTEVTIVANEVAELNVTLEEQKNTLEEVVITKTRAKAESIKSLLTQQKNNASVSDGISAESIKKTPDRTTSDVLKRISGASVQDNKFVVIRGLNDRYNVAFLNGAPLPSSESDRKAFSFDIFPSNLLDNLIITKTATPDLPADFAGGVVQINTKAVPDKNFQTISIGSGYNTITTFKEQRTYAGSSTDWIGYDNGVRAIPSTLPSTAVFNTLPYQDKAQLAKTFEYDWRINDQKFAPNYNFQYSLGRSIKFGEKTLGLIFSLSNTKSNNFANVKRFDYDNPDPTSTLLISRFSDNNYTEQVMTAGLANLAFKFSENHSLSFKNIYSINSTDLVVERNGQRDINDTRFIQADVRWFTSNKIYSGQFGGDHSFNNKKQKLSWNAFYSDIVRSIPNLRRNIYSIADPNSTDPNLNSPRAEIAANNGGPDYGGGMFFSENNENIKGGKLDLLNKFNLGKEIINEFKVGGLIQKRSRDFFARQLQYNALALGGTFDSNLLSLPNDQIFNLNNMGVISPGVNGFTIADFTKFTDSYTAGSDLVAAYAMLDNRYKFLRLVWGVRYEEYTQRINSRLTEFDFLALEDKIDNILPSVNLIISLNSKQNLRFSYSKTLNRPEFRELAPFGFYDFTNQFFTQGNPTLKTGEIKNFDIRYEIFPGKNQIFSVSYFRKNFKNPIEIQQQVNNKTITYVNANSATNSGIELEFRAVLSSLLKFPNLTILDDITLFSNIAVVKSEVDITNLNTANIDTKRPLQGQSPYVVNAGLQYLNNENGWSISANLNRTGNRIAFTESEVRPAIWEKGRTFIDLQISKTFNKKMEVKLNVQNLLAQDLIFYQNNYKNSVRYGTLETLANQVFTGDYHYQDGFNEKEDDVIWRTNFGQSISLTFTYNF
ncbi:TonB-dependent receptor [Flavobacterium sp.]|uniref:TonB-dependent receptor n=1 Tax=Flavobacterium sp. TaxID=239 RepID=UPI002616CEF7|nr:TonB-dependent receptor [Flavobacterium sp.]